MNESTSTSRLIDRFAAWSRQSPDAPFLKHFDVTLSYSAADELSQRLASGLVESGVEPGDCVAVMLQNQPEFVLAVLAIWQAGAVVVPINVMLKADEVRHIFDDSGATAAFCLATLTGEVVLPASERAKVRRVVEVSDALLGPTGERRRSAPATGRRTGAGGVRTVDITELANHEPMSQSARDAVAAVSDLAALTYTSGTTGLAKGVMNTHENTVFGADSYRQFARLTPDDVVMGGSPLFSITGLVANIGTAIVSGGSLVLAGRFEPIRVLTEIVRNRCTFTVMPITAYGSLLRLDGLSELDLSSLTKAYGGGATVGAARVTDFKEATNVYIHNSYGLTEAAGATHVVPLDAEAPIDEQVRCVSAGFPLAGTRSRIVDLATGEEVEPGGVGEVQVSGPHVMRGYWQNQAATDRAFVDGYLRTSDLGRVDAEGWYYVVGRAKDVINTSGWKVWPHEVEETIASHPAVREVAVVGVPDVYREEAVRAYVVLTDQGVASEADLIAYCRERLAVYKCPRSVVVIDELPKTPAGKVLKGDLPR